MAQHGYGSAGRRHQRTAARSRGRTTDSPRAPPTRQLLLPPTATCARATRDAPARWAKQPPALRGPLRRNPAAPGGSRRLLSRSGRCQIGRLLRRRLDRADRRRPASAPPRFRSPARPNLLPSRDGPPAPTGRPPRLARIARLAPASGSSAELDATGASQARGSCKHQRSSRADGGRATGCGHRQPRRCRQRKYRASTKAGVGPLFMSDVLLANWETQAPVLA
jgi:hypothetical protein